MKHITITFKNGKTITIDQASLRDIEMLIKDQKSDVLLIKEQ